MKTAKITAVLTVFAALMLLASSASAYSLERFEATNSTELAGGHPDFTTDLVFPEESPGGLYQELEGNVRDAVAKLPPGMVGDPTAIPQCLQSEFSQRACPSQSQVGIVVPTLYFPGLPVTSEPKVPLFNMQPSSPEQTANLAFIAGLFSVQLSISVRTDGDYGLTVRSTGIPRLTGVRRTVITTWGVPGDTSHESEWLGMSTLEPIDPKLAPPRVPFFTNPTRCDAPLDFSGEADSYQEYGVFGPALTSTTDQLTGCDELEFEPSLKARPTTNAADAPSGLDVDLKLPQNLDPDGRATAELRNATVTLPEGLVVNPSSANGLGACTPAQIGLTTPVASAPVHFGLAKPSCPDASRLGDVEVDTPVFADPLKGSIYLASPHQNPFGSLLALYLVLEGHGLVIKLPGKIQTDPQTGRITTSFEENPQTPFEHLRLKFNAGSVAPLRTPSTCGRYATTSVMSAWSAPETPVATPKDEYEITQGPNGKACGTPANSPSFEAGSTAPLAGAYRPFVVNLRREDGTQQFSSVSVSPPPGLVAKLAGTPTCSDAALAAAAAKSGAAEQANPSCPAASAVGTVYAAAGAGPTPYNAPGTAYLTGPYKGAPLSLAIVTPAVAGPFDLGTIVVRTALNLDPKTAQVTAVSDPIPTILQGIPLDIRSVSIRLDKPGFTLNPTSCDPSSVGGSLLSSSGSTASLQSRFQLAECGRLKFKPSLSLSLKGPSKRGGYPALTAILKPRAGDANIASVSVALPHSEFLAQEHIRTICTRVQFAASACPQRSIYGKVTATSPLLDYPVSGPVYLRSSDNKLPDLALDLRGPASQPVRFEAAGRTDSINGGIRNTFDFVPDVPVTKLVLQLQGAKKGLLVNSRDICANDAGKAEVTYTAHNGSSYEATPPLQVKCGGKAHKKAKGSHQGSKRG
jgi:hypothetical protein